MKTGVFTGSYAINPVNGLEVPIWVADYVLVSYGTGAIMAVPAHDERDFEFAKAFKLPIKCVVRPSGRVGVGMSFARDVPPTEAKKQLRDVTAEHDEWIAKVLNGETYYTEDGEATNSDKYNYLSTPEFKLRITADLAEAGLGIGAVNYKLRDWLFSRQRFWGEPFPILHELDTKGNPTGLLRPVPADQLPVNLPELADFKPIGEPKPPLEKAPQEWLYPVIDGKRYKRETNTMPQWAGSCWYYLRFLDNKNNKALVDPEIEKAWMPVDLYIGGAEHAVLHLLYSRFWHKVLFDRGYVSTPEPFMKLVNQGMILGANNEKMSKSRGNVVNPDEVIREYGTDALRLYEMFMGPLEATKPWSMAGVNGVRGFLDRAWRLVVNDRSEQMELSASVQRVAPTDEQNRILHKTIAAVTNDLEHLDFNTAIARMMEFTNFFTKETVRPWEAMEKFVLLVSPFAPHLAEELWEALGHKNTLAYEPWPQYDERWLKEDTIEVPVQINGKLRGKISVPAGADQTALEAAARADSKVAELLAGKMAVKTIVVPGRLVNFVVK